MYSGTLALFSSTSSSGVANREVGLEGNYGLNEQPSGDLIQLNIKLINQFSNLTTSVTDWFRV